MPRGAAAHQANRNPHASVQKHPVPVQNGKLDRKEVSGPHPMPRVVSHETFTAVASVLLWDVVLFLSPLSPAAFSPHALSHP